MIMNSILMIAIKVTIIIQVMMLIKILLTQFDVLHIEIEAADQSYCGQELLRYFQAQNMCTYAGFAYTGILFIYVNAYAHIYICCGGNYIS